MHASSAQVFLTLSSVFPVWAYRMKINHWPFLHMQKERGGGGEREGGRECENPPPPQKKKKKMSGTYYATKCTRRCME